MPRKAHLGSVLATFFFLAGISNAQQTSSTPIATTSTDSPAMATTPASAQDSMAMNPTAVSSTQVERTVVSDRPGYGNWGLLGLLGLLGLTGLRRREGEVTVVNRTTTQPPADSSPPTTRR